VQSVRLRYGVWTLFELYCAAKGPARGPARGSARGSARGGSAGPVGLLRAGAGVGAGGEEGEGGEGEGGGRAEGGRRREGASCRLIGEDDALRGVLDMAASEVLVQAFDALASHRSLMRLVVRML
jgi:hypothetical protein